MTCCTFREPCALHRYANGERLECFCHASAARFSSHSPECDRLVRAALYGTTSPADAAKLVQGPVSR